MASVRVEVLRTMNGGEFNPGDKRDMSAADAERLERRGAVRILAKKAPRPRNKMAQAPENKGGQ